MLGQCARWTRSEVVGIRDEQITVALFLEDVEQAGFPQRGIEVAMPRWAPFQIGIRLPCHRFAGGHVDLRLHMLDDFDGHVFLFEMAVLGHRRHRVSRGAERVHEGQRQRDAQPLAGSDDLPEDDVEEPHRLGFVPAHRQQRLRVVEAHRRAQPAVELEECGLGERIHGFFVIDCLVDIVETGDVRDRFHFLFADPAGALLVAPHLIQVLELRNGGVAHAMLPHLVFGAFKCVGHGGDQSLSTYQFRVPV